MTITLWISAIVIAVVFVLGPYALAWRSRQIDAMTQLQQEFFSTAQKLLDDPDTPMPVIRRLDVLAHNMEDGEAIRSVFWAALNGELRSAVSNPSREFTEFVEAVRSMRQELRELLSRAITASIFAASYKSLVIGTLIRRVILFAAKRSSEQATFVAASMRSDAFHNDGNHAAA